MKTFSYLLDGMTEFDALLEHIKKGKGYVHTLGVSGSQKTHLIYALGQHHIGKTLVVTPDDTEAGRIAKELSFLFCDEVLYFPSREYLFYDVDVSNRKNEYSRLSVLAGLDKASYIVCSVQALASYTLPYKYFKDFTIKLDMNSVVDMEEFVSKLVHMGYFRVSSVETVGQFSVRGSIIDVFSPGSAMPVRIELWGDDIDSMRYFSPDTQLSGETTQETSIYPCAELMYTADEALDATEKIRKMKNENLLRDIEKFSQSR